jgi:hypothetical protein
MDIVLALVIGLSVACVVFMLGRALVGSGSASEKVQHRPGFLHSTGESPVAVTEAVVDQAETAQPSEPIREQVIEPPIIEPPKKARKSSTARKSTPGSRRRKTAVPGAKVVQ